MAISMIIIFIRLLGRKNRAQTIPIDLQYQCSDATETVSSMYMGLYSHNQQYCIPPVNWTFQVKIHGFSLPGPYESFKGPIPVPFLFTTLTRSIKCQIRAK